MASPQVSALSDATSPIASVKRPRSHPRPGQAALGYDQILSISNDDPAEERKEDESDTFPDQNGRPSDCSIPEEELFSPTLTGRDCDGDSGEKGTKAPPEELPPEEVEEVISLEEEEQAAAQVLPEQEFNPYQFMKRLPPYEQVATAAHRRRRLLPPQAPIAPARRRSAPHNGAAGGGPLGGGGPGVQPTRREQHLAAEAAVGGGPTPSPPLLRHAGGSGARASLPGRTLPSNAGGPAPERPLPPAAAAAPHQQRPTLVLDLDETLVHCSVQPTPEADLVFPVLFNGATYRVHVRKRPHLDAFLRRARRLFEVVVFTASQRVYADALLDRLDPGRRLVEHRLFREACLEVERNFLKDLRPLGRDPRRTVLVDNSPYAYAYQPDNGVPIASWFDDAGDTELLKLLPFLEALAAARDVRPIIRKQFKTYLLVENAA